MYRASYQSLEHLINGSPCPKTYVKSEEHSQAGATDLWNTDLRSIWSVARRPTEDSISDAQAYRDYQISYILTYGAPDRHSEQLISNTLIYTEYLTAAHSPTEHMRAAHIPTKHLRAAHRPTEHLKVAH
jgi:hypothetical protein